MLHLILLTIITGCQKPERDDSVLVVGTSADFAPISFIDPISQEIVGFDIDCITHIAQKLGKKLVIKNMPFDSLIFDLLTQQIDLIAAGLTPTSQRSKKVLFSDSYAIDDPLIIITPATITIDSMNDLEELAVIVNTGYTADIYLSEKYEQLTPIKLKSPAESFLALKTHAGDAYLTAQSTLKRFITDSNKDEYHIFVVPQAQDSYAFAANKQNEKLIQQINEVIAQMHQDGTIITLLQKWNMI